MAGLRHALATLNFARMGWPLSDAVRLAEEWSIQQNQKAVSRLPSLLTQSRIREDGFEEKAGGRVFLSCHYSLYALAVKSIAARCDSKTVYVLVGEQTEVHAAMLVAFAKRYDVNVDFIYSGVSMVRRLKSVLSSGYPVLLLVDVPWGRTTKPDASYPFADGGISVRSAYFRLVRLLGFEHRFVLVTKEEDGFAVSCLGSPSEVDLFSKFEQAFLADPSSYERMYEIHKYYRPRVVSNAAACFQVGDEHYVVHAADMKGWRISSDVYRTMRGHSEVAQERMLAYMSNQLSRPVDALATI